MPGSLTIYEKYDKIKAEAPFGALNLYFEEVETMYNESIIDRVVIGVENGDTESVTAILDGAQASGRGYLSQTGKTVASTALMTAALQEDVAIDMAYMLIEKLGCAVDIFLFLRMFLCAANSYSEDMSDSAIEVIYDITNGAAYDQATSTAINMMSEDELIALACSIINTVNVIDTRYSPCIIKSIYEMDMISDETLFSLMAGTLNVTDLRDFFGLDVIDGITFHLFCDNDE